MARAIQNACNARYKLLLAKQEDLKKKPEAQPGVSGGAPKWEIGLNLGGYFEGSVLPWPGLSIGRVP
jgi:hypothetical protein